MSSYKIFFSLLLIIFASLLFVHPVLADTECKWIKGGGGNTCGDAGYPIISSLANCQAKIGDPPNLAYVCCCKNVVAKNTTTGSNTTEETVVKDTANWSISGMTNPVRTINPSVVIGRVVRALLLIVGSIALIMFIYGGLTWMTASGNDAKIAKARTILIWSTLGLIVIFAAYLLVKYVMEAVGII